MSKVILANNYCTKVFDGTHNTPKPVSEGVPLVTSKHIIGRKIDLSTAYNISQDDFLSIQKRSAVKQWDILFSMIGSVGEVYLEQNENISYTIKNIGVFSCEDEYQAKWLYYYLQSPSAKTHIKRYLNGAVQKFLSLGALREFPILKYDKSKNKIIDILSSIDAKIELNNKINRELEAMAKMLYDYWFVQFDFPNENGKPYKTSGGLMVYNEELKREIPEGWEVRTLGDYAQIKKGTLITEKTADTNGNIKVVSAGIDYSYFHSKSNYSSNTITVSASGANAGFINFWREPIFACDCTTVRGESEAETLIILEFLKMRQEYLYSQAKGSAQPHVYPKDVETLEIAIPTDDLIISFGEKTVNANKRIANNIKQNQQLIALRDWLLPMLMNGQVTVRQAHGSTVEEAEEKLSLVAEPQAKYKK